MKILKDIAQEIFEKENDVIVVQIRELHDVIDIRKSTLVTMAEDKPMHGGTVFFRSIHYIEKNI